MRLGPLAAILVVIFAVLLCGCSRTATTTSTKNDSANNTTAAKQQNRQPQTQADTQQASSAESRVLPPDHPIYKRWPRAIETAVSSPDGKVIAVYDGKGVFLTDANGKHVRKVPITLFQKLANEEVNVAFAFRPDSKRIAVLTTLNYGEPMGASIERLWTADAATGKSRRLSEWEDRIQGSSPVTAERQIEGWTKDGKSIIVVGTVYGGEEMPVDARKIGTQRVIIKDSPSSGQQHNT